jgi:hypothetical protein
MVSILISVSSIESQDVIFIYDSFSANDKHRWTSAGRPGFENTFKNVTATGLLSVGNRSGKWSLCERGGGGGWQNDGKWNDPW